MEKVIRYKTFDNKYFEDEESASAWEQSHYRDKVYYFYHRMKSEVTKLNYVKTKLLPGIEKVILNVKELSELSYDDFSEKVSQYFDYCGLLEVSEVMRYIEKSTLMGKNREKFIEYLFKDLKSYYKCQPKKHKGKIRKIADDWKKDYSGRNILDEYHHLFIEKIGSSLNVLKDKCSLVEIIPQK